MSRWRESCGALAALACLPLSLALALSLDLPPRNVAIVVGWATGLGLIIAAVMIAAARMIVRLRSQSHHARGVEQQQSLAGNEEQRAESTEQDQPIVTDPIVVQLPRHRRVVGRPRLPWVRNMADIQALTAAGSGVDQLVVNGPPAERESTRGVASSIAHRRVVFVVHGRDMIARECLFDFLRSLNLWPMDWEEVVQASGTPTPYMLDAVRAGILSAYAVLVLETPDDVVRLHRDLQGPVEPLYERHWTCQPRPNVILEEGMAWGLRPGRVAVLQIGQMRQINDLGGLNTIRFNGSVDSLQKVAQRLSGLGCDVAGRGIDQQMLNRFNRLAAHYRQPR